METYTKTQTHTSDLMKQTVSFLDYGGTEVLVGIPSLICHGYAVCGAFECWQRAANEDVERGRTFSWLKQAITRKFTGVLLPS